MESSSSLNWRIYYGDDSVFDDAADPFGAPPVNCQVIAQRDPDVGRTLLAKKDFYWLEDDLTWNGGDIFGLWDYLARPGPKKVVFGRTIPNRRYAAVVRKAVEDPAFPPKSARREGEDF